MEKPYPLIHYNDYLKLDQLLDSQKLMSEKYGKPAHDEMLFIIVHQVYELWFKQILTEVDSVAKMFGNNNVDERNMGVIVSRLERVIEIQKLLMEQIPIMETMTPLEFLEFRDMLYPASGFQSFQFRLLENKLGLKRNNRIVYNARPYETSLTDEQAAQIKKSEESPNLFELIDQWLARTPFLKMEGFDFWVEYESSVLKVFDEDENIFMSLDTLNEDHKQKNLEILNKTREEFKSLFSKESYKNLKSQGAWSLSYEAIHGALLIQLYRDEPILQLPFRLLTALLNIDEQLSSWRYRHALMAKRMLGTKIGTGGSSGHDYLKKTAEQHRVFDDFFKLTTFFIPRSRLPDLPAAAQKRLGFYQE